MVLARRGITLSGAAAASGTACKVQSRQQRLEHCNPCCLQSPARRWAQVCGLVPARTCGRSRRAPCAPCPPWGTADRWTRGRSAAWAPSRSWLLQLACTGRPWGCDTPAAAAAAAAAAVSGGACRPSVVLSCALARITASLTQPRAPRGAQGELQGALFLPAACWRLSARWCSYVLSKKVAVSSHLLGGPVRSGRRAPGELGRWKQLVGAVMGRTSRSLCDMQRRLSKGAQPIQTVQRGAHGALLRANCPPRSWHGCWHKHDSAAATQSHAAGRRAPAPPEPSLLQRRDLLANLPFIV